MDDKEGNDAEDFRNLLGRGSEFDNSRKGSAASNARRAMGGIGKNHPKL